MSIPITMQNPEMLKLDFKVYLNSKIQTVFNIS